jgi:ElaB/YqjD/DUF883 family membrane-anchored ribosome-binding protein
MKDGVKSQPAATPGLDQVKDDIAALTRDVAALLDKVRTLAVDGASEAARESSEQLGEGARMLYDRLVTQGQRSANAVGRQIEAQPILSLLVAFGVGFCASRLLVR